MIKKRGTKLADESDWMELGDWLNVVLCKLQSSVTLLRGVGWRKFDMAEEIWHIGVVRNMDSEMTSGL